MFTNSANLTEMLKSSIIGVDDIIQKSFLELNEEGTEAAAVSEIGQ